MPTNFLWIAGRSSVGKRTTIQKSLADPDWCRQFFGLGEVDVVEGCYRPAPANNPDTPNDDAIADIVGKANVGNVSVTVLIFWQAIFRTAVPYLKSRRPDDHHLVAHLHRDRVGHLKSYLDDYRKLYESDEAALRGFEEFGKVDRGYVEEYRAVVDRFIEVTINGDAYRLGAPSELVRA